MNLGTENLEVWKTPGYSLDFELGLTYARGPIPQLFFLKKKEKQNKNPKCFLNVLSTLFHHPNDFSSFCIIVLSLISNLEFFLTLRSLLNLELGLSFVGFTLLAKPSSHQKRFKVLNDYQFSKFENHRLTSNLKVKILFSRPARLELGSD